MAALLPGFIHTWLLVASPSRFVYFFCSCVCWYASPAKKVYVTFSYFFNYFISDHFFSVTMQFRTDYCSCTSSHASLFSSSHGFQLLAGFFPSSLERWFPLCCFQPCFSVFIFIEWSQLVIQHNEILRLIKNASSPKLDWTDSISELKDPPDGQGQEKNKILTLSYLVMSKCISDMLSH